jgi:hypothetical protein
MRYLLAVALVVFTASSALAQSPSTPVTPNDDVAAAVPTPGGWCEGKADDGRGTNFGRCFGSAAKTSTGALPESGGAASGD